MIRLIITALRKVFGNRHHILMVSNFENQSHTYFRVELNVTMEQPISRVISDEPDNCIPSIRDSDCVFHWSMLQVPVKSTGFVQILDGFSSSVNTQSSLAYNSETMTV